MQTMMQNVYNYVPSRFMQFYVRQARINDQIMSYTSHHSYVSHDLFCSRSGPVSVKFADFEKCVFFV